MSSKDRLGTQKKVSGPLIAPNDQHELLSDAMVICRSNTLVKCGSFPAISELAECDSLSNCTIASSSPSSSSVEQATELLINNHNLLTLFANHNVQKDHPREPVVCSHHTQHQPKRGFEITHPLR